MIPLLLLRLALLCAVAFAAAAQPSATGTVTGIVFDASTGRPLPLVQISVDGMTDRRLMTDTQGRFTLQLAPGTYNLRFSSENYLETTIERVEVKAGTVTEASTVMQLKSAVTTVEVVEKLGSVSSTAESLLTERKLAASVSDSISSQDIRDSPASDAAAALEKVTGVSVVDNGYVYVRGLGERYSSTMLNNAILPSTEPERRVVPLDLFPAALIDHIRILKSYSPELPGEFSGGLVQLQTVEFPTQKTFQTSVSYGFNQVTTGRRFAGFSGGSLDVFGFDDGARAIPSEIPTAPPLFVGNYSESDLVRFGRAFRPEYTPRFSDAARPYQTYSIAGGNTYGRLGIVGALTFSNQPQRFAELRRFLTNAGSGQIGGGRAALFSDYPQFDSDTEGVRLGGVLNASLRLTQAHKLVFRNTLTRDTDKEARIFRGIDGGTNTEIEDTRLRWTERQLYSTGLEGDHVFAPLGNSLLRWQFTYAGSFRGEPDLRETIRAREIGSSAPYSFVFRPLSGTRFFSTLDDRIYEPQAEVARPFFRNSWSGMIKAGVRVSWRRRDFDMRRFRFVPIRASTINTLSPTDEVLGPTNIRPDGLVLREITTATDRYDASMDISGGYAMVDLAAGNKWRVIGGVRVEDARIRVTTINPLIPGARPALATLDNRDLLPGLNVIYALTSRQNLRAGYSRTLNRPDFRELSPFEFTSVVGGFTTVGNPNLLRATIDNFDIRWEWFPGGSQVMAASYFYKRFQNPIEQTYQPTGSELRQSFGNVAGAHNQGVELELRRNLRTLSARLADFAVQTNFTFVDSEVVIPDTPQYVQLTSRKRPLVGQSRFIFNLVTEWTKPHWRSNARFYLNSVSRRITDVGTFQLPDAYQERMLFLDVIYQYSIGESGRWRLRFSAENLGNNLYRYTQGDFIVRQFRLGRTFTVGTTVSFF
jgi:outer membrane receptor protein involved in Fe transport